MEAGEYKTTVPCHNNLGIQMNSSARRRRTMSSSSSSPSALSHDTIIDILSRLPVKSLTRFRSVSKHWADLTANPTFIAAHLRRSSLNPSLLVRRYHIPSGGGFGMLLLEHPGSPRSTTLDLEVPLLRTLNRFPRMVGSSNGLLCLEISSHHALDLVLWNVSMRQFEHLPSPAIVDSPIHMVSLGFGFDCVNNDYKIVRIVYVADSGRTMDAPPTVKAEVFSWRRDSWKEIDAEYGPLTICGAHNGVEVNGTLYWVTIRLGESLNRKFLLSFDMADEGFRSLPLPQTSLYANLNLACYKGSLAFAVYPGYGSPTTEIQLWVMNGVEGERANWAHMFTINGLPRNVAPIGLLWGDVKLVLKQMKGDAYCLWFYDHRNLSQKRLLDVEDFWFDVCPYVESLVPVSCRY